MRCERAVVEMKKTSPISDSAECQLFVLLVRHMHARVTHCSQQFKVGSDVTVFSIPPSDNVNILTWWR